MRCFLLFLASVYKIQWYVNDEKIGTKRSLNLLKSANVRIRIAHRSRPPEFQNYPCGRCCVRGARQVDEKHCSWWSRPLFCHFIMSLWIHLVVVEFRQRQRSNESSIRIRYLLEKWCNPLAILSLFYRCLIQFCHSIIRFNLCIPCGIQ